MNLAALFGDDQHINGEDSYVRAMKCRKWVVLAAVGYYLTHATLIGPQPFSIIVARVIVPLSVLQTATAFGLAYITVQYLLQLLQCAERYQSITSERNGLREAERMGVLQAQLQQLASHRGAAITSPDHERRMAPIDDRMREIETILEGYDPTLRPSLTFRLADYAMDAARAGAPILMVITVI